MAPTLTASRDSGSGHVDARGPAGYRGCGDRPRSQALMSSAGEDHALLLGFTMMGVAVLMYFLFGLTLVRPYLHSNWKEESNCTLVRAEIQQDRVDCKKHGSYPCLEVFVNLSVFVNLTLTERTACFSLPKCQWNKKEALKEAQNIQQYLRNRGGSPFPCHGKAEEQPDQAILFRKYNGGLVVRHMLWATLVLAGGTGIICLLRLNQHLSRLCEDRMDRNNCSYF
uniref:Potassium calcium-activated channel subfamily M regulatory beta subunit 3 n=1 Tax=Scleropages formosus TaxID=113540 RepID=A0A8C9RU58_SCLFO